ncbi:MAG: metal ABC transporter ATP-binding protein [Patescibacteria group bacterium]
MPVESNSTLINCQDLSFSYGGNKALQNISFEIKAGEYVALIGPNGGGKTTLIKILLGLLNPDSGSVRLFNESPLHLGNNWSKIGYVPQKSAQIGLDFPATVKEVLATANQVKTKQDSLQHSIQFDEILKLLDIEDLQNRLLSQLSGGERQKVFLARALMKNPALLVLDEPTVGVDSSSQAKFYRALDHLNQSHGLAILLISHDIAAVVKSVQRVLCLNQTLTIHEQPEEFAHSATYQNLYGNDFNYVHHHH